MDKKTFPLSYYLAALLALPLSLINGYGLRTVFYVLYLGKIATYQGEWAGIWDTLQKAPLQYVLTFQYLALTYFTYLALTVFLCLVSISKLKKHPFYLFLSTSLVVPLVAFRQAPLVTLLSLPLLALLVKDLPQRLRSIVIFLIFCITVGLGWLSVWIKPVGLPVAVDTEGDILVTFLRTHELTGKTFANQQLGSYLSYYLDPDVKVFVDTRDDLFLPTQVFPDILDSGSVLTLAQTYGVDQFVLDFADDGPRFQPLLYSRTWVPVFVNNEHLVVVREEIAQAKGLPVLDAIDPFSNSGAKVGLERQASVQYGKGQNPSYQISLALALGKYDQAKKLIDASPLPLGPSRPLAEILNQEMLSEIAIYQNDCTSLMASVNRIKNSQRSKFLFSPKRLLPSNIGKYAAFAALLCDGDREKAKKQLQQFLSQSRNSLIVEDKLWRQFDNAATDVRPRDLP
ncbi:hypothetical protein HY031_02020 [Candidatus Gottesmanbacteria bacterium]|nr:hypothetical protein [Candidatus Gottesmanbacteria bacterium]